MNFSLSLCICGKELSQHTDRELVNCASQFVNTDTITKNYPKECAICRNELANHTDRELVKCASSFVSTLGY